MGLCWKVFSVYLFPHILSSVLTMSGQVQVDTGIHYDVFTELPVSLVLFALICVDIVERIRPYHLRGQGNHRHSISDQLLKYVD